MTTPAQPTPAADPVHPTQVPGYKTSEFWLTLIVTLTGLVQTLTHPNSGAGIAAGAIAAGATSAYGASRAYTKSNAPTA